MSLWEAKDVKGHPSRGRIFVVPFSAVVHECKQREISHQTGERIQIAMRNLNRKGLKENDWLLAELRPMQELTIYSVPDYFDTDNVSRKTLEAIEVFARLNPFPLKQMRFCTQFFQAYLRNKSDLSLCHVFWHFKQSKYRGDQKFSRAFNKRPGRTEFRDFKLTDAGIEYRRAANH